VQAEYLDEQTGRKLPAGAAVGPTLIDGSQTPAGLNATFRFALLCRSISSVALTHYNRIHQRNRKYFMVYVAPVRLTNFLYATRVASILIEFCVSGH